MPSRRLGRRPGEARGASQLISADSRIKINPKATILLKDYATAQKPAQKRESDYKWLWLAGGAVVLYFLVS